MYEKIPSSADAEKMSMSVNNLSPSLKKRPFEEQNGEYDICIEERYTFGKTSV